MFSKFQAGIEIEIKSSYELENSKKKIEKLIFFVGKNILNSEKNRKNCFSTPKTRIYFLLPNCV